MCFEPVQFGKALRGLGLLTSACQCTVSLLQQASNALSGPGGRAATGAAAPRCGPGVGLVWACQPWVLAQVGPCGPRIPASHCRGAFSSARQVPTAQLLRPPHSPHVRCPAPLCNHAGNCCSDPLALSTLWSRCNNKSSPFQVSKSRMQMATRPYGRHNAEAAFKYEAPKLTSSQHVPPRLDRCIPHPDPQHHSSTPHVCHSYHVASWASTVA